MCAWIHSRPHKLTRSHQVVLLLPLLHPALLLPPPAPPLLRPAVPPALVPSFRTSPPWPLALLVLVPVPSSSFKQKRWTGQTGRFLSYGTSVFPGPCCSNIYNCPSDEPSSTIIDVVGSASGCYRFYAPTSSGAAQFARLRPAGVVPRVVSACGPGRRSLAVGRQGLKRLASYARGFHAGPIRESCPHHHDGCVEITAA